MLCLGLLSVMNVTQLRHIVRIFRKHLTHGHHRKSYWHALYMQHCNRCARFFIFWMIHLFIISCRTAYVILHFHHCHPESRSSTLKVSLVASCFIVFHYIQHKKTILTYHLFISELHYNIRQLWCHQKMSLMHTASQSISKANNLSQHAMIWFCVKRVSI